MNAGAVCPCPALLSSPLTCRERLQFVTGSERLAQAYQKEVMCMFNPFCKLTGVECMMVGKDDPCPLPEADQWFVLEHNGFCRWQVEEDFPCRGQDCGECKDACCTPD